jgi:predicted transcriptional regulator
MTTTTLTLDDATQRRLEELAAVRGVTPEEIIREALEKELEPVRHRPRSKSIGMGASGQTDLARRISDEMPELPPWR